MRKREQEIILGAVVFFAAVIVVVGAMWLSERYAGAAGGYRVRVQFESVPGLQVGNPVTFRGVWVGKVLGIYLDEGQPIVTLGFAKFDALPVDSRIIVKSDGLLGGQMVEIYVGNASKTLADNALIDGEMAGGMEETMAEGGKLLSKVNQTVNQVASDQNLVHISNTIARFDTATQILNTTLAHNQKNLKVLLDSLALASGDASGLLRENRADLRTSVKNLKDATGRMGVLAQNMEETSQSMKEMFDNLNQITGQMRSGQGTVGKLIQEDSMYQHLDRTLTTVDSLIEDVKRDPTRYFKFSVF
ncbi:MAG: MCE family protein [Candidatus Latescibacteria bacterium]|jgi:phospholipid/cholesterol/gamma-HCH transport system substrate-binding protein|nr:MCE family protein [Candidatus Latescibacterota bacterium]MBT5829933.1 MCE family protein [Candidatus Latescibacterota bacterium]